jgi:hypothetical protein
MVALPYVSRNGIVVWEVEWAGTVAVGLVAAEVVAVVVPVAVVAAAVAEVAAAADKPASTTLITKPAFRNARPSLRIRPFFWILLNSCAVFKLSI